MGDDREVADAVEGGSHCRRLADGAATANANAANLSTLYASLAGGSIAYSLSDVDPFDNFYDFTQGVDGGLINVGSPPVVTGTPEPASWALMIMGFGLVGTTLRRRHASIAAG